MKLTFGERDMQNFTISENSLCIKITLQNYSFTWFVEDIRNKYVEYLFH